MRLTNATRIDTIGHFLATTQIATIQGALYETSLVKIGMLRVYVGQLDLHKILDHLIGYGQTFAQESRDDVHDFFVQFGKTQELLLW